MKGNTKKTDMFGFAACWSRGIGSQKTLQLPSSRKSSGTGWLNSPEYKHLYRAQQRLNKTGGIPRGKAYAKMFHLGYRSECQKDLTREIRSV